ncbi:hypothetical protein FISHEDRAFT_20728, partial [Fistulina hepatica ATCC 64428]
PPSEPAIQKKHIGRRTRYSVLLVPFVVILITLSSRYVAHPASLHLPAQHWNAQPVWDAHHHPMPIHARAESASTVESSGLPVTASELLTATATSAAASATTASTTTTKATTTTTSDTSVPTVPTDPVLPTPFPQAFDSEYAQNFSSVSCLNFFANMTSTMPFRSCRPFSLLLQTSDVFINAQSNLTELNAIIWGTCNTTLSEDQCLWNMKWFADEISDACSEDISDRNPLAVETRIALRAYPVMRQSACLVDPTTDAYCYVEAVPKSNPADLYVYNLPLGTAMPSTATPSCSSCTKTIMGYYADALENDPDDYTALADTYNAAEEAATESCGESYATAV